MALCLMLASLFCSGCGQGNVEAGSGDEAPGSASPETSQIGRGDGHLIGTGGDDDLRVGDGEQVVRGGAGNDEIRGGEGRDRLFGGPGDDVIDAQDPGSRGRMGRDEISCGPGRDEVLMDAEDGEKPKDCEMAGVGQS